LSARTLVRVIGFLLCALPLMLQAQSPKVLRVGVLAGGGPGFDGGFEPFRQRLRELGYAEGKGLALEVRNAQGRADRYPALAGQLVRQNVDVIVVQGNAALFALNQATKTIPIVMANIGDPVGSGFVASLTRPGGNITGLSNMAEGVSAKWLELLRDAAPTASRVAVLWDPENASHQSMWKEVQDASRPFRVTLKAVPMRSPDEITRAFAAMVADKTGAAIVLPQPAAGANLGQIALLAAEHRLPAIYMTREFASAGGLMSYGPSVAEMWRRAAEYVDKIAKGANAAELPVDQPTKFALVVNRSAAAKLGLTLPPSLLVRAEEILE
jgi:putative ABC transport system substrate-binding protein